MIFKTTIKEHLQSIFWIRHKILMHILAISVILLCSYCKIISSLNSAILLLICFILLYNYLEQSEILKFLYAKEEIIDEKTANKNLPSNEYILNLILDNIPIIAYYRNSDNEIKYTNKKAKDFFKNYKIEDNNFDITQKELFTLEKEFIDANNEKKYFNIYNYPISNNKSENIGFYTITQDVSLEYKMRQQHKMYIAIITHDLKTPVLAQVRSLTALLDEKDNFTNEQEELIKNILDSTKWVYKMLSVFLDICKFEDDNKSLTLEPCDIEILLNESFSEISNICPDKNITFRINSNTSSTSILCDKKQLILGFSTLLKLSTTYVNQNSEIVIKVSNNKEVIAIEIISYGRPFNKSLLENLLIEDITNTSKYNKVGEGLELYLAQQIIKKHNGTIRIEEKHNNDERTIKLLFKELEKTMQENKNNYTNIE